MQTESDNHHECSSIDFNPYDELEVDINSPIENIKSSYQRLVLRYHPDKNAGKTTAQEVEKFHRILSSWKLLSSPEKKIQYDRWTYLQSLSLHSATEVSLKSFASSEDGIFCLPCRCGDNFEVIHFHFFLIL